MNKLITYCLLLILYLGLSKSLSPSEFGISFVNSNESLSKLIPGSHVSVILTDIHSTGFLIKTYYQKYKIVYGFQSYEELIVRTSKLYKEYGEKFIGMSVFRRDKEVGTEDYTPLPPGSTFIGDKNFGRWVNHNSGEKVWTFFRAYRQIPDYLGWGDFVPTAKDAAKINLHRQEQKPYFGPNNEFGKDGSVTKKSFPKYFERQKPETLNLTKFLRNYIKENFIK